MDPNKEKPTVETVQPGLKVSDLLMVEVCQPLKEQLDQIDVCRPHLPESRVSLCRPGESLQVGAPCYPTNPTPCFPCGPHGCMPCPPHGGHFAFTTSLPFYPTCPPNCLPLCPPICAPCFPHKPPLQEREAVGPEEVAGPCYPVCSPNPFCLPWGHRIAACGPDYRPIDYVKTLEQKLTANEINTLQQTIAELKAEVEALKNKNK